VGPPSTNGGDALFVRAEGIRAECRRHPGNRDSLIGLVSFAREDGDFAGAIDFAERRSAVIPNGLNLASLIEELRRNVEPKAQ
jgi:hypothetical protein